jgi:hypothetical protein
MLLTYPNTLPISLVNSSTAVVDIKEQLLVLLAPSDLDNQVVLPMGELMPSVDYLETPIYVNMTTRESCYMDLWSLVFPWAKCWT